MRLLVAALVACAFLAGALAVVWLEIGLRSDDANRGAGRTDAGSLNTPPDPAFGGPWPPSASASRDPSASPAGTSRTSTAATRSPAQNVAGRTAPPPPGQPAQPGRSGLDGTGPIIGLHGQCLDNDHSHTDNGNQIQLWVCDVTPAQSWTVANGRFSVQGKCMATAGTAVVLWDCNSDASQVWRFEPGDGTVRNPITGLCLTATDRFTKVAIAPCAGAAGQKWARP